MWRINKMSISKSKSNDAQNRISEPGDHVKGRDSMFDDTVHNIQELKKGKGKWIVRSSLASMDNAISKQHDECKAFMRAGNEVDCTYSKHYYNKHTYQ